MNNPINAYEPYKLKEIIDPRRLNWHQIIRYENTIPFIEKYIEFVKDDFCFKQLSKNPFAVEMLSKHVDKIKWNEFVTNPNAIHIVDKHFDLCFQSLNLQGKRELLKHPNFVHILKKNQQKIVDEQLFIDCLPEIIEIKNPQYVELLEKYWRKYPEKIKEVQNTPLSCFWLNLCENPYAIHLIEENLDKIPDRYWVTLATNKNAIHLLEKIIDNLNLDQDNSNYKRKYAFWNSLSENPNAIPLLEKNFKKISWHNLWKNINAIKIYEKYPDKDINNCICNVTIYLSNIDYKNLSFDMPIFELDYETIEKRCNIYKEELMQVALHPSRIERYIQMGISVHELDKYI